MPLAYSASNLQPSLSRKRKGGPPELAFDEATDTGDISLSKSTSTDLVVPNLLEDTSRQERFAGDCSELFDTSGASLTSCSPNVNEGYFACPDYSSQVEVVGDPFCIQVNTKMQHPKAGFRVRVPNLMAPPASDAEALRRQVMVLQSDLEAHIDGEQHLQVINQQLRERLEVYMKQNHESVDRAETELNTLHEDMEQTLELQRRLAQRASQLEGEKRELEIALRKQIEDFQDERSSLQSKIDNLSEDLQMKKNAQDRAKALQKELDNTLESKWKLEKQLQNLSMEAEKMRHKAEEYGTQLSGLITKERQRQFTEIRGRKAILSRYFHRFQSGLLNKRASNVLEVTAIQFHDKQLLKQAMNALRLATHRAICIRMFQIQQAKGRLSESWKAWHLLVLAKKKCARNLQRRRETCRRRLFFAWKHLVKMGKLTPEDEYKLDSLSSNHRHAVLCKLALSLWITWLRNSARPKNMHLRSANTMINTLKCKQVLDSWRSVAISLKRKKSRIGEANSQHTKSLSKHALNRWSEVVKHKRASREVLLQRQNLWKMRQKGTIIQRWSIYAQTKIQQTLSESISFKHYLKRLQLQEFKRWRQVVRNQKAEKEASLHVNQTFMKASMFLWKNYHIMSGIKKRSEWRATVENKRRQHKIVRWILYFWWEEASKSKLYENLRCRLESKRIHARLQTCLRSWMHGAFDHIVVANARYQIELIEIKAKHQKQKELTSATDVENLHLVERLHVLSSEIAFLKTVISEKEKQEKELHHALEDDALIESSMQSEIEQKKLQIEELEIEIIRLKRKLQNKNVEDVEGEVHNALEIQKLQMGLKELYLQLAEKSSQVDAYEKALRETAERLEGASDESRQKLSSAFQIAASLRKLLEDREGQFAILEGNCQRRDLELAEMHKKLELANTRLVETAEDRNFRIRDLEKLLVKKQSELEEAHLELQEVKLALYTKDNYVRKLEYDVKLKCGKEARMLQSLYCGLPRVTSWADPDSGLLSSNNIAAYGGHRVNVHYQTKKPEDNQLDIKEEQLQSDLTPKLHSEDEPSIEMTRSSDEHRDPNGNEERRKPSIEENCDLPVEVTPTGKLTKEFGSDLLVELKSTKEFGSDLPVESKLSKGFGSNLPVEVNPTGKLIEEFPTNKNFIKRYHNRPSCHSNLHDEIQRLQDRIMSRIKDCPS